MLPHGPLLVVTALQKIGMYLTNEQILQVDFYDLCGSASVFMTDQEKIDYFKKIFPGTGELNKKQNDN